jgi:LuxR family maltose regulon positive regulatory protein
MSEPLKQLLRTQRRRPPNAQGSVSADYVGKLLEALGAEIAASSGASTSEAGGLLVDPLSERELEVLKLLDSDLSNREIATRMFVSLDTVKTHTKHLYRKLGVRARHQAVARAKELGFLQ